jgi:hypothetical protein
VRSGSIGDRKMNRLGMTFHQINAALWTKNVIGEVGWSAGLALSHRMG